MIERSALRMALFARKNSSMNAMWASGSMPVVTRR
jgi:hypothetical protein